MTTKSNTPTRITETGTMHSTPEQAKIVLDWFGSINDYTFERINGDAQHSGIVLSWRRNINGCRWLIAAVMGGNGVLRFQPTVIGKAIDESDCKDEDEREELHSSMDDIRLCFAMNGITFIG